MNTHAIVSVVPLSPPEASQPGRSLFQSTLQQARWDAVSVVDVFLSALCATPSLLLPWALFAS
jgi:hypothetical protein